jgi:peroxiredoxin
LATSTVMGLHRFIYEAIPFSRRVVIDTNGKIKVGDKAPDFGLPDTGLRIRKLKDFSGKKVVLAFFPGAFTSVCTREMCTFRDSLARFNKLKAEVVGISVNDPWTQKAFASDNELTFTLLSDYNRDVVNLYGVAAPDSLGLKGYTTAKRSVFIVDTKGVIRYVWVSEDPRVEPNYKEIEEALGKIN